MTGRPAVTLQNLMMHLVGGHSELFKMFYVDGPKKRGMSHYASSTESMPVHEEYINA